MGGIPRGALSGPLQSPSSSLCSPGTTGPISAEHQFQLSSFAARLLDNSAGYGPAFFSLTVEASLLSKPFSRQEQIAKDGDPAA